MCNGIVAVVVELWTRRGLKNAESKAISTFSDFNQSSQKRYCFTKSNHAKITHGIASGRSTQQVLTAPPRPAAHAAQLTPGPHKWILVDIHKLIFIGGRRIFIDGWRIFIEGWRIFIDGSRIFIDGSRIFMDGCSIPVSEDQVCGVRLILDPQLFIGIRRS